MNTHQKFLEFNGKNIVFLNVEGTYWIALKPICEALNIDVRRSRDLAKSDPILAPEVSEQALQVSKNGKNQLRYMTCIREEFVYGWIFSLRSDSVELTEYKRSCYKLLYNHFHGTITNRKELLLERKELDTSIHHLTQELKSNVDKYKDLQTLQTKRKAINALLNSNDNEIVKEQGFWG